VRSLTKRGIVPGDQPSDVDERLTRDARRFYHCPAERPSQLAVRREARYTLIEPTARDFLAEVAFRISEKERRVIDLAPRLGCACSGAVVGEPWTGARDAVAAMERRARSTKVLDHDVPLGIGIPLEPWSGSASEGQPTFALPCPSSLHYTTPSQSPSRTTLAPASGVAPEPPGRASRGRTVERREPRARQRGTGRRARRLPPSTV